MDAAQESQKIRAVVSLDEARTRGLLRYFTGLACANGHLSERRTAGGQCLECERIRRAERKEYTREFNKKCRLANRAKCNEHNSAYAKRNSGEGKLLARKRLERGLPTPAYAAPNRCECCGGEPGSTALHLDHDHISGEFRGWLCKKCNSGIGMLGDNEAGVINAINYLRRSRAQEVA